MYTGRLHISEGPKHDSFTELAKSMGISGTYFCIILGNDNWTEIINFYILRYNVDSIPYFIPTTITQSFLEYY